MAVIARRGPKLRALAFVAGGAAGPSRGSLPRGARPAPKHDRRQRQRFLDRFLTVEINLLGMTLASPLRRSDTESGAPAVTPEQQTALSILWDIWERKREVIDEALMGTTVIVTGLSNAAAHSLVILGVDLTKLNTSGDLQSGVVRARSLLSTDPRVRAS